MNNSNTSRVFGLDLMRAIAISCVLLSHGMWIFPELDNSLVNGVRGLGFFGVEIFFVLSGFLIGRILYRLYTSDTFRPLDFRYFLLRRWFRTLPNYYLVLLINIPIWVGFSRPLPDNWHHYFFFAQNLFSGMSLFFTESWSLPIEEFAYLLIPAALFLLVGMVRHCSRKSLFLYAVIGLLVFFMLSKCYYHIALFDPETFVWNIDLKAVTIYRIDAIVYGVLAAYLSMNYSEGWYRYRFELLGAGLMVFAGIHLIIPLAGLSLSETPFYRNVLYLPLLSVAIACSLPVLSSLGRCAAWYARPVRTLSLISYSVYLLHYSIVLQLMRYVVPIEGLAVYQKLLFLFLYLIITLVLSYVLYRAFELPMMNLRDNEKVKRLFRVI